MPFESLDFPVKLMDIPHPMLGDNEVIKGRKAIVRADNGEVLNIVSGKYPLVKHIDVFGPLDEAIKRLEIPVLKIEERSAMLGGYAKVTWTLDKRIKIPGHNLEDNLDLTISARNSYNYTSIVALTLGTYRLICSNGLSIGTLVAGAQKRHVPSLDVAKLQHEIIAILEKADTVATRFARWAEMEYPSHRLAEWVAAPHQGMTFSKEGQREILEYYATQPDRARVGSPAEHNGWEALNAITWYGTHRVKTRSSDTKLLAEERIDVLANIFSRQELEGVAFKARN